MSKHLKAVVAAFFVTILWSSSWVLIKIGLNDISPLIFAGIRYFLAASILFAGLTFSSSYREEVKQLNTKWWSHLIVYGLFYYAITQGTQFVGLFYLPAITVSFMLNLTSIIVLILGIFLLQEYPNLKQVVLMGVGFFGVFLYFYPVNLPSEQVFGLLVMVGGVLANAISSIMGRNLNQQKKVSPFVITTISMMIGSIILLIFALLVEGVPSISVQVLILIVLLAVVNTAIAFVIWNYTLQEIKAVESSIINSTMLPQITILAMIFFDESLILKEWIGLGLIFVTGMFISLLRRDVIEKDDPVDQ